MHLFKFIPNTEPTELNGAIFLNGIKSTMWVERYRDAGEFELKTKLGSGLRELLPRGSFISHVDTEEIMIVEDHQINSSSDSEGILTITGRSAETLLDIRTVGANISFPTSGALVEYVIASDKSWDQAVSLIEDHILAANVVDSDDEIPFIEIQNTATGTATEEERTISRGSLYDKTLDILSVDKLGIKTIRPGPWSPAVTPANIVFVIHKGEDKSATVSFSYKAGETESIDYLWSIKNEKNGAYVYGRWVDTVVYSSNLAPTGYNRRMMAIDASDLDDQYDAAPSGATRTAIVNKMKARGKEALGKQKELAIVQADISKTKRRARYRIDYDLGDIVTVYGDYDEASKKRVIEYVEIEDENGFSEYPSLDSVEEE